MRNFPGIPPSVKARPARALRPAFDGLARRDVPGGFTAPELLALFRATGLALIPGLTPAGGTIIGVVVATPTPPAPTPIPIDGVPDISVVPSR